MKSSIFFLLLYMFSSSCSSNSVQKDYLDEVFKIIEENALNRNSIDLNKIKAEAYAKLDTTQTIEDCYPIVRSVLTELNDHHSFFMEKEKVDSWKSTGKTKSIEELVPFSGQLLHEDIGYIDMKGFSSGDSLLVQEYADSLQSLIGSIDNRNIKGWILDLRNNTGGNCWPMLAGIGPLLGNGICGYFIDYHQNESSWYYSNGETGNDSIAIVKVSEPHQLLNQNNPIAILTGPKTMSSGEVVTVAFRGKSNVRSFGMPTRGLSTGNDMFELSDGSMILLTTSIYADRKGNHYGKKIIPDRVVNFSNQVLGTDKDQVINSAIDWIHDY